MIKKMMTLVAASLLSFSAFATQFTEGDYYKVLDQPQSDTPIVAEYFSFYCPHCYRFEPTVQALKKELPENVVFQKNHVSFMGGANGKEMSKAFASAIVLETPTVVSEIFKRIHVDNKPPRDAKAIREIFVEKGITAENVEGAFNSFAVNSIVNRSDKAFKDSGLTGVPALIVNNKYLVKTGKITSSEQYFELVNYLLTK